jgi:predicted transcriptional regulator
VSREIETQLDDVFRLTDDERTAVRAGMDDARRGDFAPAEEIEAFYQLHRKLASLPATNAKRLRKGA